MEKIMKIIQKSVVAIFMSALATSCALEAKPHVKDFEKEFENAKQAQKNGDFATAGDSYRRAAGIADKMNWTEGKIMALRGIADSFYLQKNIAKSIETLRQAKDICGLAEECASNTQELNYSKLSFHILNDLKDLQKYQALESEMKNDPKLSANQTEDLINKNNSLIHELRLNAVKDLN